MNLGKVVQVIGPVVDVEFPSGNLPAIHNAVRIKADGEQKGEARVLTGETAQHLGDNTVRLVALGPTDGLRRGMAAEDTGAPISVPEALPVPPARDAPPMTTAAMASSSYPLAACGCAEESREARTTPAMAAKTPDRA